MLYNLVNDYPDITTPEVNHMLNSLMESYRSDNDTERENNSLMTPCMTVLSDNGIVSQDSEPSITFDQINQEQDRDGNIYQWNFNRKKFFYFSEPEDMSNPNYILGSDNPVPGTSNEVPRNLSPISNPVITCENCLLHQYHDENRKAGQVYITTEQLRVSYDSKMRFEELGQRSEKTELSIKMYLLRLKSKGRPENEINVTAAKKLFDKLSTGRNQSFDTIEIFSKRPIQTNKLCDKFQGTARVEFQFALGGSLEVRSRGKIFVLISYNAECYRVNVLTSIKDTTTYNFRELDVYSSNLVNFKNSAKYFESTILLNSK